jgi:hypothetical protein
MYRMSWNLGASTSWNPQGLFRPVMGLLYLYLTMHLNNSKPNAVKLFFYSSLEGLGPPLWSSGKSFWLQIQRSQVRFPALPGFLSSSGSGPGSTQPREFNWGATWIKRGSGSRSRKQRFNGRGDPLRWRRDTPLSANVGTNFADRRRPLYRYSSLAD